MGADHGNNHADDRNCSCLEVDPTPLLFAGPEAAARVGGDVHPHLDSRDRRVRSLWAAPRSLSHARAERGRILGMAVAFASSSVRLPRNGLRIALDPITLRRQSRASASPSSSVDELYLFVVFLIVLLLR